MRHFWRVHVSSSCCTSQSNVAFVKPSYSRIPLKFTDFMREKETCLESVAEHTIDGLLEPRWWRRANSFFWCSDDKPVAGYRWVNGRQTRGSAPVRPDSLFARSMVEAVKEATPSRTRLNSAI